MLALNVKVNGDKVIIDNIQGFAEAMPLAAQRGLKKVVRGVHRGAMEWLNGAGRSPMRLSNKGAMIHESGRITNSKSQLRGQSDSLGARPGSYPVPTITGNLKRLLNFLEPGQGKDGFSAGPLEAIDYDSAEYASVIAGGTGSSSAYGPRDFLVDGLKRFNGEAGVTETMEAEYAIELKKWGLA